MKKQDIPNDIMCCSGEDKVRPEVRSWEDEKIEHNLSNRLNRIEGQVRGIKRMVEDGAYCDDILNQISSCRSALFGVAKIILEKHMNECIKTQLVAGDNEVIEELTQTVFRLIKSG